MCQCSLSQYLQPNGRRAGADTWRDLKSLALCLPLEGAYVGEFVFPFSFVSWSLDMSLVSPLKPTSLLIKTDIVKIHGFPDVSIGKESTCNAGDTGDVGSVPGLGRSPGGGNGNPLQYSCLENPMDRGAWWATVHESQSVRHNWELTLTVKIETSRIKNLPANAGDTRDAGFNPWVGKIPWRMAWQPILVPLPGESHGQRSLVSYGPQGHKELETTEVT